MDLKEVSIKELNLSTRSYNGLTNYAKVKTVDKLMNMTDAEILGIRTIGPNCLKEIKEKLEAYLKTIQED